MTGSQVAGGQQGTERACTVDSPIVYGQRVQAVCALLAPLAHQRPGVSRVPWCGDSLLVAHGGVQPGGVDYGEWRFNTFVPSVVGMYSERWAKADKGGRRLFLAETKLHLLFHDRGTERELVLVHCEPNLSPDPPIGRTMAKPEAPLRHALYKRSLHLHVARASFPLDHSHWPLVEASEPIAFVSLSEFERAQARVVEIVREQVLRLLFHKVMQNEEAVRKALGGP